MRFCSVTRPKSHNRIKNVTMVLVLVLLSAVDVMSSSTAVNGGADPQTTSSSAPPKAHYEHGDHISIWQRTIDPRGDIPLAWKYDPHAPPPPACFGIPPTPLAIQSNESQIDPSSSSQHEQNANWYAYSAICHKLLDWRWRYRITGSISAGARSHIFRASDLYPQTVRKSMFADVAIKCSYNIVESLKEVYHHSGAISIDSGVVRPEQTFIYVQASDKGTRPVICRVQELVWGQTIWQMVKSSLKRKPNGAHISHAVARRILKQVLSILASLHRHGLVVKNIDPKNFILDDQTGQVRITNFALAVYAHDDPFKQSPEHSPIVQLKQKAIDIRTFGLLLRYLFTGEDASEIKKSEQLTGRGHIDALLLPMFGENREILGLYEMARDPFDQQPSIEQLMEHPYFGPEGGSLSSNTQQLAAEEKAPEPPRTAPTNSFPSSLSEIYGDKRTLKRRRGSSIERKSNIEQGHVHATEDGPMPLTPPANGWI